MSSAGAAPGDPIELVASLDAAAGALGLPLMPRQAERLLAFLGLLQHWNKTYNLTAIRDPRDALTQHVVDCLAAVGPFRRELAGRDRPAILDVGSGGGLPGVVLAIMLPDAAVTCIDSVGKKAAFVRQVAVSQALGNLQSKHARVEAVVEGRFDIITARAFSSLSDLVRLSRHLLAPGGVWAAMKGKSPDAEIAELAGAVRVRRVDPLTVPGLAAERCLVWIENE